MAEIKKLIETEGSICGASTDQGLFCLRLKCNGCFDKRKGLIGVFVGGPGCFQGNLYDRLQWRECGNAGCKFFQECLANKS